MKSNLLLLGLLTFVASCSNASNVETPAPGASLTNGTSEGSTSGVPTGTTAVTPTPMSPTGGTLPTGPTTAAGSPNTTTPGSTTSVTTAPSTGGETSGTTAQGTTSAPPSETSDVAASTGSDEEPAATGSTNETTAGGPIVSSCVGQAWPSADPTRAGVFQVTADKEVGPLAGVVPDPIYGEKQQRFNVYRPSNLAQSGYCHPILIWANGYRDNPEQKPPDCVVDGNANRWCGQYSPLLNHLASHGFVVVASLSTATAEGDPLPTIAGLDWILEQAEDPSSPYYHRLDTANIGQLGHSYGGMSTCMSASEPRYKALATICGTRALTGVHTPMLFYCGGRDTTVRCDGVKATFQTVTEQPAFFLNERDADHGSWVYEGANGVSLSSAAAWFRAHLMGDAESRKFFYGAGCRFCSDNRVEAEQNSLMMQ